MTARENHPAIPYVPLVTCPKTSARPFSRRGLIRSMGMRKSSKMERIKGIFYKSIYHVICVSFPTINTVGLTAVDRLVLIKLSVLPLLIFSLILPLPPMITYNTLDLRYFLTLAINFVDFILDDSLCDQSVW